MNIYCPAFTVNNPVWQCGHYYEVIDTELEVENHEAEIHFA